MSMRFSMRLHRISALLLTGVLAGCSFLTTSAQAQKATNTVVWGMVASPRHLNPAVQSGINTMEPGAQIFASPLRVDDKWQPQPYLAESWKYEDDNKSLVLKVRKGATFHDGKPITSADFAYSIMAVKANHPFQTMMAPVEKVDTPDAETAIIRLSQTASGVAAVADVAVLPDPAEAHLRRRHRPEGASAQLQSGRLGPVQAGRVQAGRAHHPGANKDFFSRTGRSSTARSSASSRMRIRSALAIEAKEVHFTPFLAEISVIDKLATVPGLNVTDKGGHGIGPLIWLAFNTAKDAVRRCARAPGLCRSPSTATSSPSACIAAARRSRPGRSRQRRRSTPRTSRPTKSTWRRPRSCSTRPASRRMRRACASRPTLTHAPGSRDLTANVAEYIKAQLKKHRRRGRSRTGAGLPDLGDTRSAIRTST